MTFMLELNQVKMLMIPSRERDILRVKREVQEFDIIANFDVLNKQRFV